MDENPKKYAEYCVYKIYHFLKIFHKVTLKHFECIFIENFAGDFELFNAVIYDAESKLENFLHITKKKNENLKLENLMADRIKKLIDSENQKKEEKIQFKKLSNQEKLIRAGKDFKKRGQKYRIASGKRRMFNKMKHDFITKIKKYRKENGFEVKFNEIMEQADKDFQRLRPDITPELSRIVASENYDYEWIRRKKLKQKEIIKSLDPEYRKGNKKSWIDKVNRSIIDKRRRLSFDNKGMRKRHRSEIVKPSGSNDEEEGLEEDDSKFLQEVYQDIVIVTALPENSFTESSIDPKKYELNTDERNELKQIRIEKKALKKLYEIFSKNVKHKIKDGSLEAEFLNQRLKQPGQRLKEKDLKMGIFSEEKIGKAEKFALKNKIRYKTMNKTEYPRRENPFRLEEDEAKSYIKQVELAAIKKRRERLLLNRNNLRIAQYAQRKKSRGGKSKRTRTFLDEIVKSNLNSQINKKKILRINEKIAKKVRKNFSKRMHQIGIRTSKSLDLNLMDIKHLEKLELIPTVFLKKKLRMKEIGLSSTKWSWKPKQLESVCFDLVDMKDAEEETILSFGQSRASQFKHTRENLLAKTNPKANIIKVKDHSLGSTCLDVRRGRFSKTAIGSKMTSGALFRTLGTGQSEINNQTFLTGSLENEINRRSTLNGFRILDQNEVQKIFRNSTQEKSEMNQRIERKRGSNLNRDYRIPNILKERLKSKTSFATSNQSIYSAVENTEFLKEVLNKEERAILIRSLKHEERVDKARQEGRVMPALRISDIDIGRSQDKDSRKMNFKLDDYKSLEDYERQQSN